MAVDRQDRSSLKSIHLLGMVPRANHRKNNLTMTFYIAQCWSIISYFQP
jgi:hypothetical protein